MQINAYHISSKISYAKGLLAMFLKKCFSTFYLFFATAVIFAAHVTPPPFTKIRCPLENPDSILINLGKDIRFKIKTWISQDHNAKATAFFNQFTLITGKTKTTIKSAIQFNKDHAIDYSCFIISHINSHKNSESYNNKTLEHNGASPIKKSELEEEIFNQSPFHLQLLKLAYLYHNTMLLQDSSYSTLPDNDWNKNCLKATITLSAKELSIDTDKLNKHVTKIVTDIKAGEQTTFAFLNKYQSDYIESMIKNRTKQFNRICLGLSATIIVCMLYYHRKNINVYIKDFLKTIKRT